MPDRRALAKPFRARQEFAKLLDAIRMPKAPRDFPTGHPRLFVPDNQRPGLPHAARSKLLIEAAEVCAGSWRTFGGEGYFISVPIPWRTGGTGEAAPLTHWSRMSVLGGPGGADVKEIWELNRHRGLLRLAQAWYLERDPAWVAPLASHFDTWLAQNPPGLGINWASSLEVGFRALAWTWIRALTSDSTIWTPERDQAFAASLWHHGRHLSRYDSVHHSPNTHLTGEGVALAVLGRTWPDWPGANRWRTLGDRILREELEYQVLPDGMHIELAPGYHRYTLEFYLLWIALLQQSGEAIPESVRIKVEAMIAALALLRRPDGRLAGIGDEDGGVALPLGTAHPRDPAPAFGLAAGLLGDGGCAPYFSADSLDLAWWVLGDSEWEKLAGSSVSPPRILQVRLASLPSAGYHVLREGTGSGWWCLVDAGPQSVGLPGHTHCDLGHVEIQWEGRPVVSDPGSLAYGPDQQRRDRDRSPESHASLTVDGAPLAQPAGPFRWARLAPTPRASVESHPDRATVTLAYEWEAVDGTALRHERQVCLLDEAGVIVVDRLIGAAGRALTLSWPLPAPSVDIVAGPGEATLPGNIQLHWLTTGMSPLTVRMEEAEFAETYRAPAPGTFLRLEGEAEGEAVLVSCFTAPGQSPMVSVAQGTVRIARQGRTCIELAGGLV